MLPQIQMYHKKSTNARVQQSMFMSLYALFIQFPVRHTVNFRFDVRYCIGDLMAHTMIRKLLYSEFEKKVPSKCKPKFQQKAFNFSDKTNHKNSFFAGVLYLDFLVSNQYFCQQQDRNQSKITFCGEITRWRKLKQFSCDFIIHDEPWHLLDTLASQCIRISSTFCAFFCQGKSKISSINAHAYFRG